MWSKHFYLYCVFNTFDKIHLFVRTINLFIHLASDLYMIHSPFSRTSPNFTAVTDVHCTNPVIDNKRSRNDQKKIFKNTFKNRKLPTILTIWSFQRWNRTKFRLSDETNSSKLELVWITKQLTGLKHKKTGHRFHVIWMLQNRLSVIFRALRGHEFLAHSISCPELNSRTESFECDGSCNHYRGQDPEASLVVISGAKQTTASGPTIARLRYGWQFVAKFKKYIYSHSTKYICIQGIILHPATIYLCSFKEYYLFNFKEMIYLLTFKEIYSFKQNTFIHKNYIHSRNLYSSKDLYSFKEIINSFKEWYSSKEIIFI